MTSSYEPANSSPREKGGNLYRGFTLLELLIVIAILAVLAAVTVVVINPAELLSQARDSSRVTSLNSLERAIGIFSLGASGAPRGFTNRVYISLPDPTSSTCASHPTLPRLPTGWTYNCVTAETLQRVDGQGWIPIDFTILAGGSPLAALPIDPINNTAHYLAYVTGGSYAVTAMMESSRFLQRNANRDGGSDPARFEVGTNFQLWARATGLVGYWPLDGNFQDHSGLANHGTQTGGVTFAEGRQNQAGRFDGVDDHVNVGNSSVFQTPAGTTFTYGAWIRGLPGFSPTQMFVNKWLPYFRVDGGRLHLSVQAAGSQRNLWGTSFLLPNRWHHAVATFDAEGFMRVYLDGVLDGTAGPFLPIANTNDGFMRLGIHGAPPGSFFYRGFLDEVRIYNRALSADEIRAIFEATR